MPRRKSKTVDLVLPGGGARGVFARGALDLLSEEEAPAFEGICAACAGAMDAAAPETGPVFGGPRACLAGVPGSVARFSRTPTSPLLERVRASGPAAADAAETSPDRRTGDTLARRFPPQDRTPFTPTALHDPLSERLVFDAVCTAPEPPFFVGAATVRSGETGAAARRGVSSTAIRLPPACRRCCRRGRSAARPLGIAASPATRRRSRCKARPRRAT